MHHVSTHIPEPFRTMLVKASTIVNDDARIERINQVTANLRKAHPELFWNERETRARELRAQNKLLHLQQQRAAAKALSKSTETAQ